MAESEDLCVSNLSSGGGSFSCSRCGGPPGRGPVGVSDGTFFCSQECHDIWMNPRHYSHRLGRAEELTKRQAEDEGLWFQAETAAEAYLQQELRRLHRVVEGGDAE